jgi:hypothetical protein
MVPNWVEMSNGRWETKWVEKTGPRMAVQKVGLLADVKVWQMAARKADKTAEPTGSR